MHMKSLLLSGLTGVMILCGGQDAARAAESSPEDPLILAMHHGRPHGGRHERHQHHSGMGRSGKGICPQTRTAPPAPDKIAQKKNPFESNAKNFIKGESLYQWTAEPNPCKTCHGPEGNGLGMMAHGLQAMPRNFTCTETMKEVSDGQMFWIIRNGSGGTGMPAFKFLSDDDIWKLILYIRHFDKK